MNIVVYLGANMAKNEIYNEMCRKLGEKIAENGHTLIYGGSKTGMMGLLADGAVSKGGKVIGVEPEFFVKQVLQHQGIDQLIVTDTMAERRSKMIELGDLFIAFPGGVGTLDEISEVMALRSLGLIGKKECIIFNFNHFYDDLKAQIRKMLDEGFLTQERLEGIHIVDSFEKLMEYCSCV